MNSKLQWWSICAIKVFGNKLFVILAVIFLQLIFQRYVRDAITPTYEYLMTKSVNESSLTFHEKLLRISIVNWACKYRNTDCVTLADNEFYKFLRNQPINVDLKPAVYCHGLRSSIGNWNRFWEYYTVTNYATEQSTVLTALGCSKREADIRVSEGPS